MAKRRCRWCGELGHNIRSCPKRKERVEELENSGNPHDRKLAERHKQRFDSQTSRRCSYCRAPGHTIRTCPDFKQVVSDRTSNVLKLRRAMMQAMKHYSLGVGSLIESSVDEWSDANRSWINRKVVGLVTEIRWNQMGVGPSRGARVQWSGARLFVTDTHTGKEHTCQMPWEILEYVHNLLSANDSDQNRTFIAKENSRVRMITGAGISSSPENFLNDKEVLKWTEKRMKGNL